jgi:hypothetical protein
MSGHADTISSAINSRPTDFVTRDKGRAALDALVAENQRLRDALAELQKPKYGVATMTVARAALAATPSEDT